MFKRRNALERTISHLNYLASKVKESPSKEKIEKASAVLLQLFYETYRGIARRYGKTVVPFIPDYFSLKAAFPLAHYLLTTTKEDRESTILKLAEAMIYYFTNLAELEVPEDKFLHFSEFMKKAQVIANRIGGIVIDSSKQS